VWLADLTELYIAKGFGRTEQLLEDGFTASAENLQLSSATKSWKPRQFIQLKPQDVSRSEVKQYLLSVTGNMMRTVRLLMLVSLMALCHYLLYYYSEHVVSIRKHVFGERESFFFVAVDPHSRHANRLKYTFAQAAPLSITKEAGCIFTRGLGGL